MSPKPKRNKKKRIRIKRPLNPVGESQKIPKTKIIKKYIKQKCAFIDDNGIQCKRNAVGKSTLCKRHGGKVIIKENLVQKNEEHLIGLNTKFDPSYHPLHFIDMSRMGLSEVEIAAKFEVGIGTMKSWSEKYAEFNTAYEIGQALHESWWLTQGKSGLRDRGFNTTLFKFLTANKLGYSEKIESKNTNMNVHGVLVIPNKQTEDEWEEDIINVNS